MSEHNIQKELENANMTATGKLLYVASQSAHLIEFGAGAPSGTAVSKFYINTTGTTTTTLLYGNVDGTWTAITIS